VQNPKHDKYSFVRNSVKVLEPRFSLGMLRLARNDKQKARNDHLSHEP